MLISKREELREKKLFPYDGKKSQCSLKMYETIHSKIGYKNVRFYTHKSETANNVKIFVVCW